MVKCHASFYNANSTAFSNVSCITGKTNTFLFKSTSVIESFISIKYFLDCFHSLYFCFLKGNSFTYAYLFFFCFAILSYTFQQHIYSFIIPALLGITEIAELIQYQQVPNAPVTILVTAVVAYNIQTYVWWGSTRNSSSHCIYFFTLQHWPLCPVPHECMKWYYKFRTPLSRLVVGTQTPA